jgi:hypothetical protein
MAKISEDLDIIKDQLDAMMHLLGALPEWYPLTLTLAQGAGYDTVDGLRKWCKNNIHPDYCKQIGKMWHVHRGQLAYIQQTHVEYGRAGSRQS